MSSIGDNTDHSAESPTTYKDSSFAVTPLTNEDSAVKPPLPTSKASDSRKKKRSWVWDHFIKLECIDKNDQKANCKYCDTLIACPSKSGTSGLINHANRCKKHPQYMDKKQKTLDFRVRAGVGEKELTTYIFDEEACRKALARMIILEELPFRIVEREGFLAFCRQLQPRFLVPSRTTMTRDCHNLFLDEKKKLKSFFNKLSSRVCLTTDTWTSIQNLNYMCLTANFIDDQWILLKKIISFCPITGHSGEIIGRSVEGCLLDWEINKVLTVTVDNASSNETGLQYLRRRLNSWKGTILNGDYLHMRCAAHILSLIVREGLKELDDSVVRIQFTMRYVRSSPARVQRFKSCIEKERIESKSLVSLDVETRWNSTYLMLESAVKFQKVFELLDTVDCKYVEKLTPKIKVAKNGEDEEFGFVYDKSSRTRGVPTEYDWNYANNLLHFLKAFYESTERLSGSLYVTGNSYMIEIFAIGFLLKKLMSDVDYGISSMAYKMKKKYDKYWGTIDRLNLLLFIAVILDPRYKLKYALWVIDETFDLESANKLKENVTRVLKCMFDAYSAIRVNPKVLVIQSQEEVAKKTNTLAGAIDLMNSMYFDNEENSNSTENKTELDIYLLELCVNRNDQAFEILGWWRENGSRYPVLSMMVRDVLAIPVSTVASGSAFSTGDRVLESFRSSLTPKMVEYLVCVQDWLRKSREPLYLEEILEDLEKIELEMSYLTEEHPIINIEE